MFLNENIVVAYHKNCADGYFAALNVYRQLNAGKYIGIELKFTPVGHNDSMIEIGSMLDKEKSNTILFVDFVPTPTQFEELKTLVGLTNTVFFAIDHHKGNLDRLKEYTKGQIPFGYVYTEGTSGAGLVDMLDLEFTLDCVITDFLQGKHHQNLVKGDDDHLMMLASTQPLLTRYVTDIEELPHPLKDVVIRDMWIEDDKEAKEIADCFNSGFRYYCSIDGIPEPNSDLAEEFFFGENWHWRYQQIVEAGKEELKEIKNVSTSLVNTANIVHGNGFAFGVNILNNTPSGTPSMFGNMMCDKLSENHKHCFAIGIYLVKSKRRFYDVKVELRSNGSVNCAEIAKFINKDGGGHHNAAGAYFNGNVDSLITLLMQYSLL